MNTRQNRVLESFETKNCFKLIAGIDNFDKERVLTLVKSAALNNVEMIDIACQKDIIEEAVSLVNELNSQTAIMVSSVEPQDLLMAEELGADLLELGNFEALHEQGIFYSAQKVLELAKEIMDSRKSALVSITVPGHLEVKEQVELAEKLEELGVEILQTEGASLTDAKSAAALGQIEKVSLTLANTIEISKAVSRSFILSASGLSPDTVKLAFAAGANGIGVGSYVNKLNSELEILAATKAIQDAITVNSEVSAAVA